MSDTRARGKKAPTPLIVTALIFAIAASYLAIRPGIAGSRNILAHRGTLDISAESSGPDSIIPLAGEWEYYRNTLTVTEGSEPVYAELPHIWRDSRYGYATYRLTIRGLVPGRDYALKVPYMSTAFDLCMDDAEIARNGRLGFNVAESTPEYNPSIVEFTPADDSIRLVLRVSNFFHRRGGPFQTILLAERSAILQYDFWSIFIDGTLTIIFLVSGLYQIPFFILRKSVSNLWLGLFFMQLGAIMLFETPEVLIMGLFPGLSWFAFERLDYGLIYMLPVWATLFVHSMFGGLPRRVLRACIAPAFAIVAIILLASPSLFTLWNLWFQLYTVVLYSVSLGLLLRAVRNEDTGARVVLTGYLIFAASILSNNLLSGSPFPAGNYLPLSFLKVLSGAARSDFHSDALDILSWLFIFVFIMLSSLSFTFSYPIRRSIKETGRNGARGAAQKAIDAGLSEREREVALLILRGKNNNEIAATLFISLSTVKTHISRIFKKTGAKTRAGLFYFFHGE